MMRLGRIGPPGLERPIALHEDQAFDLRPLTDDIDGSFLSEDIRSKVQGAIQKGLLPRTTVEGERVGSPIARPSAIVCIGQNYAAHAAESGAPVPTAPIIFLKTPNTIVGPNDDICLPPGSQRTDWEVELAVVIGRRAERIPSMDHAAAHIAGYTVSNDVSERYLQLEASGGQWSKGKCCPTFNPLGPWLVPASELPNVQSLGLHSRVNGQDRQSSTTADMIFDVNRLVWELSQFLTLEPGDVVNTGTPEGVALSGRFPHLVEGDVVEASIDGLGSQRNRVTA